MFESAEIEAAGVSPAPNQSFKACPGHPRLGQACPDKYYCQGSDISCLKVRQKAFGEKEAGGGIRGMGLRECAKEGAPPAFRLQHPEDPATVLSL